MDPGCDRLRSTATVHNLQQRSSRKFKRRVSNTRCKPSQSEPLAHGMMGLGRGEELRLTPTQEHPFCIATNTRRAGSRGMPSSKPERTALGAPRPNPCTESPKE